MVLFSSRFFLTEIAVQQVDGNLSELLCVRPPASRVSLLHLLTAHWRQLSHSDFVTGGGRLIFPSALAKGR